MTDERLKEINEHTEQAYARVARMAIAENALAEAITAAREAMERLEAFERGEGDDTSLDNS